MERNLFTRAAEFISEQRKKKRWTKAVTAMAAVVVFCTTYALILPAITLETDVFCGQKEHSHDEGCYGQSLICTLEEAKAHVHGADCYETHRTLVCTQEESAGHSHSEACMTETSTLTCASEEEGHEHGDGCYTVTSSVTCGQAEEAGHTHGDSCWQETKTLVCTESTEIPEGGHVHDDSCYETSEEPTCGCKEHVHTDACYADPTADLESAAYWERTLPDELTGVWADDLLAVAETQLGYTESSANYIVDDEGRKLGYSRYGAWYGAPYGDWCAMFVSFCLHYANIPAEAFPLEASCQGWIEELTQQDLYRPAGDYTPKAGDLIFFNWDNEPDSDHVGIVQEVTLDESGAVTQLKTIEGNASNQVKTVTYALPDGSIMGYGELPRAPKAENILMMSPAPVAEGGTEYAYYEEVTGITFTLSLENSDYSPETHDLVVVPMDLVDSLTQNFTAHGQVVEEALNYQIYLRNNNQEYKNLSGAYKLTVSKEDGLFKTPGEAKDYSFLYCMNLNNQPTDLPNCNVTYSADGNITQIIASAGSYPNSSQFVFVRTSAPDGLRASDYTLTYNNTKDAFLTDPAYSKYYNPNSPIGTAGSFHIVAFEEVRLNSHTNGNILAKNLYAGGKNFGTNNYAEELSYVQNYKEVHATSASRDNHVLALGSEHEVRFVDNGNKFSFNGVCVTQPKNFVMDKDTVNAPLIDLYRVEAEIRQISSKLDGFSDVNLNYTPDTPDSSCSYLTLSSPSAVGVAHYKASDLSTKFGEYLRIDGFKSGHNGTVVINVDCSNVAEIILPQARIVVDGIEQSTKEVIDFSAGKVIWNFVNADNVVINTHLMTGMVVAPGATVNITQNLNGTVVAEKINVKAESHRTDFTGTVVEPDVDVGDNECYITVQKTETGYVAIALPGAEFNLYLWNGTEWKKQNTETLRTNDHGVLTLRHLEASVAYHLEETKAPDGYVPKKDGFYFWIRKDNNQSNPDVRPIDFSGNVIEVGGTLLAANEKAEEEEPSEGYILPETGGPGGQWYILGGILLITGGTLWYRKQDKGKEGTRTS